MHEFSGRVMPQKIIFLSAKQGAGKSYHARILKENLERLCYQIKVFKFASMLYEMHDVVLPILKKYKLRPEKMDKDGEFLQEIGQWGRMIFGENVWANLCRVEVMRWVTMHKNNVAIIDDGRMQNEFNSFPEALKIRLYAHASVRRARCSYWRENTAHISECDLDRFENDGLFDLVVDTEQENEICSSLIFAASLQHFKKAVDTIP